MSEVKPNSPNGQGHVYGHMGGNGHMYGYQYTGHEMHGYGCGTMPMGYGYGHQPNQAPMMHGYHHGCGVSYGHGGGSWGSMGTILVLFILLVIISKTMFI
ncbi:hypothetical protein [Paenibacillus amylolyticus]|uniref:Sporulation protein YjcZ n=1 Tax=Paenibacillus amylolyticus TaxID=1451 RepID=A0A100VRU7_PAEAM|nr:hypothetical protein [Paenibacillus amylolyticus]GAS84907.1 unknown protein [Paenibacillus amylolyticus]